MANEETAVEEKPKSKKGLIIAVVAIVNVIAIGGAFFLLTQQKEPAEGVEPEPKKRSARSAGAAIDGPIIEMEQFVVNVNTGKERKYLKTKLSVQLFTPEDEPEFAKFQSIVRNELLLQLSVIQLESIQTIDGKRELQKNLVKMVNERLDMDRVANIYFTEFVTQ